MKSNTETVNFLKGKYNLTEEQVTTIFQEYCGKNISSLGEIIQNLVNTNSIMILLLGMIIKNILQE